MYATLLSDEANPGVLVEVHLIAELDGCAQVECVERYCDDLLHATERNECVVHPQIFDLGTLRELLDTIGAACHCGGHVEHVEEEHEFEFLDKEHEQSHTEQEGVSHGQKEDQENTDLYYHLQAEQAKEQSCSQVPIVVIVERVEVQRAAQCKVA